MVDERILTINEPTEPRDVAADNQTDDEHEPTKQQLQNEMEHARESISQTINEIAGNISTQAQTIKETVVKTLDWREHVREHPVAAGLGSLAIGAFVGYVVVSSAKGRSQYYNLNNRTNGTQRSLARKSESYAAAAAAQAPSSTESNKPSLLSQIKHTQAYERLSSEAGNLVNQFIDEAVNVGKTVLVPAAISKITETVNSTLAADNKSNQRTNNKNSKAGESSPTFAAANNRNQ